MISTDLNQCQVLASQLFASVSCESLNAKLIECERKVPVLSDKIRSVCEKAYVMEEAWPRYCNTVKSMGRQPFELVGLIQS